jgi:hypothetical protein
MIRSFLRVIYVLDTASEMQENPSQVFYDFMKNSVTNKPDLKSIYEEFINRAQNAFV